MTDLFLVTEEYVPVEKLRPRDRVILPRGSRAVVERVDKYDTFGVEEIECFVVRWRWGSTLGSLRPHLRGETVKVDRRRG